jgi:peroxiredoxin
MRIFAAFAALAVAALAAEPRKAPELAITEPNGKTTLLSSMKGKVCVVEFLFTTCPHCQKEAQVLTKLQKEMGPRGLQVFGVAVNDNASILVSGFASQTGASYPIGVAPKETMLTYMGISEIERWVVPQVVVIDRKGMIRAKSPAAGDPNLQDENYLRNLLDGLLKEGAPATATKKSTTSAHR